MNTRKITSIILLIFLSAGAFILPFIKATEISYADNSIDVSDDHNNQFASNFIVFCAKAGINITGSGVTPWIMDKVDEFAADTGRTSQNVINTVNSKAGLVAGQLGLYEIGDEAWSLLNDLYDYIYQDDDIANNRGDVIGVASTKSFTPSDGKTYYLYIKDPNSNIILGHGTPIEPFSYWYNNKDTSGFYPYTIDIATYNSTRSYKLNKYSDNRIWCSSLGSYNTNAYWVYNNSGNEITLGTFCYYVESNNTDYVNIGLVQNISSNAYYTIRNIVGLGTTQVTNNTISLDINDNVKSPSQMEDLKPDEGSSNTYNINYNTYNDIINNSSTVTIINNDPDPSDPYYNPYPDNPNYDPNNPGSGTTTGPSIGNGGNGSDGIINFPNFDFHFPEINWSLGDLTEKFPFSIPFDLIEFFTVLNAEPQAPSISADIPLGTWYTWHFEADFSQFDNWAVIIRNVEFIAFCVGLIYLTIRLVKG